jgi:hypothetical protein
MHPESGTTTFEPLHTPLDDRHVPARTQKDVAREEVPKGTADHDRVTHVGVRSCKGRCSMRSCRPDRRKATRCPRWIAPRAIYAGGTSAAAQGDECGSSFTARLSSPSIRGSAISTSTFLLKAHASVPWRPSIPIDDAEVIAAQRMIALPGSSIPVATLGNRCFAAPLSTERLRRHSWRCGPPPHS